MKPQEQMREDGTRFVLIHYVYSSGKGVVSQEGTVLPPAIEKTLKIACMPRLLEMSSSQSRAVPFIRSDDPRAVTCPECQKTEPYQCRLHEINVGTSRRNV